MRPLTEAVLEANIDGLRRVVAESPWLTTYGKNRFHASIGKIYARLVDARQKARVGYRLAPLDGRAPRG